MDNKLLFSLQEVASMLGVNEMTLRRWIASGKITAIRLPGVGIRIHQDEVTRILSNVIAKTERN